MMQIVWIVVTIAAILIEIFTLGNLICIWFAVGGIVSAVLAYLNVPEVFQYIAFFVVSIIAMLIIRPLAYNYLRGNTIPTNSDRVIGQHAILSKGITETSWGEVKIDGTVWSAVTADGSPLEAGRKIIIIAIDGAKLIVKALH